MGLDNFESINLKIIQKLGFCLIEYIIKRIDRSYGKIFNFIYKLDKMSLLKKKPIDLKIIKQLI